MSMGTTVKSVFSLRWLNPNKHRYPLTDEQSRRLASEKEDNIRWVARSFATYSGYRLGDADLVSEDLSREAAEYGQPVRRNRYSAVPVTTLINHFTILNRPGYPLEHYDALGDCELIDSVRGNVGGLPALVLYRPRARHLVVPSLVSTRSPRPAGDKDSAPIRARRRSFWILGAILWHQKTGDGKLVDYFQSLLRQLREKFNLDPQFLTEYSIQGYNDGIPAVPPRSMGYRHFCQAPLFTGGGKLYRIPANNKSQVMFHPPEDTMKLFPMGGHNYYNGRDLESFRRRTAWLAEADTEKAGWQSRYEAAARSKDPLRH
ncbi:hypothetical protein AX14_008516 [Amanita brunnescens Koide BX004]|nr:hypothetical protein AX14_008516 [Amanita brunnescens Koide BX004]